MNKKKITVVIWNDDDAKKKREILDDIETICTINGLRRQVRWDTGEDREFYLLMVPDESLNNTLEPTKIEEES